MESKKTDRLVIALIVSSTLVRLILASLLELGNDEVYYWTYARYPDFSHFDHPPMVGFLAQLSTLNLFFKDDFFLRLGPILLAAFDTWIIYKIGIRVKNHLGGLIAALLFTSSIYCSIISGFALTPDAPEIFFWLLSLYLMITTLTSSAIGKNENRKMVLFGITAGLAVLSKYHGIFIWFGVFTYIVLYDRRWLKKPALYLASLASLLILLPIIYWNFTNDFISFTFHSNRVTPALSLRLDYFIKELAGQFAYNNPFNVILILPAIAGLIKKKRFIESNFKRILLLNALPLWLVFTSFSLFRSTFPHWTGPAFISLILITSAYWADKINETASTQWSAKIFRFAFPSYFLLALLIATVYVINFSPFQLGKKDPEEILGTYDFTQDMYGWASIGERFKDIAQREEKNHTMQPGSDLVSYRWFPGTHEDFYAAWPSQRNVYLIGDLTETHKYAWIYNQQSGLQKGKDYYYINVSNYNKDPHEAFGNYFESIQPIDTVKVMRGRQVMRYASFFLLKNYKGNYTNPLPEKN